jgi:hypothetical protein
MVAVRTVSEIPFVVRFNRGGRTAAAGIASDAAEATRLGIAGLIHFRPAEPGDNVSFALAAGETATGVSDDVDVINLAAIAGPSHD